MSGYSEFGFGEGDSHISSGKFERFKPKQGETYRISFVHWPEKDGVPDLDAASPKFVGARRFYIQGVGYVLDKGPEVARLAGGGSSKMQIATIIAVWPTDRKGQIDKARINDVEVKPWVFSQGVYDSLKTIHNDWLLGQTDITVTCTDTQFQKLTILPAKGSLIRKAAETPALSELAQSVYATVRQMAPKLTDMIARDLTPEQIREKLGGAPAASAAASATFSDVDVDAAMADLLGD